MNIEFHYYIINYLTRMSGFSIEESYKIAYSSQYTDNNNIRHELKKDMFTFSNYISQTKNILKPKHELMRIYMCFHFIPGDYETKSAYRKDGKMHLLNTTPDSENSRMIMKSALETNNMYRIGIAVHAYADTWAHQNFVGYFDHSNSFNRFIDRIIPDIGHANALLKPDKVSFIWEDDRLVHSQKIIVNSTRYLTAAEKIYHTFLEYNRNRFPEKQLLNKWAEIKSALKDAIGQASTDKDKNAKSRIKKYIKLIPAFIEYDEFEWINKAVDIKVRGWPDNPKGFTIFPDEYNIRPDFEQSDWYQFQLAVKAHQAYALEILKPRFDKMELEFF